MSRHLQSLLGFRATSASRDPDSAGSAKAETPKTTKKIQETLDWQTLNNHLVQFVPKPAINANDESMGSTSSGRNEVTPPMLSSSSTQRCQSELLIRKFQEAHAEMGRRAVELNDTALQLGDADVALQRELQVYKLLMSDAAELCCALANKMSRLRTKMGLSSSLRREKSQPRGYPSQATQQTGSYNDSGCTQHRSWVQPKAPEQPSSRESFCRRATSARQGGRSHLLDASKQEESSESSQPVQRRTVNQTRYSRGRHVQGRVTGEESAKATSEAQPQTLGDLPPMKPDDDLRLDQASTLPDLPQLTMESQEPSPE